MERKPLDLTISQVTRIFQFMAAACVISFVFGGAVTQSFIGAVGALVCQAVLATSIGALFIRLLCSPRPFPDAREKPEYFLAWIAVVISVLAIVSYPFRGWLIAQEENRADIIFPGLLTISLFLLTAVLKYGFKLVADQRTNAQGSSQSQGWIEPNY